MKKSVLVILLKKRRSSAIRFQKILTRYGCIIKTRLGIHDGVLDKCSDTGLVILEIVGMDTEKKKFARELKGVPDLKLKLVELS